MTLLHILWIVFGALPIAAGLTFLYLKFLHKLINKKDMYL